MIAAIVLIFAYRFSLSVCPSMIITDSVCFIGLQVVVNGDRVRCGREHVTRTCLLSPLCSSISILMILYRRSSTDIFLDDSSWFISTDCSFATTFAFRSFVLEHSPFLLLSICVVIVLCNSYVFTCIARREHHYQRLDALHRSIQS